MAAPSSCPDSSAGVVMSVTSPLRNALTAFSGQYYSVNILVELDIEENADIKYGAYDDIPVQATTYADAYLGESLYDNKPSPIQRHAIPVVMDGRDLMACAQDETAAFCVPIISRFAKKQLSEPVVRRGGGTVASALALILTTTSELSSQIHDEARKFSNRSGVKAAVVYVGAPFTNQGVDILVAKPGRVIDMVEKCRVSLGRIKCLALDESYRMSGMRFQHRILKIVDRMGMPPSGVRQIMLFSATFPTETQGLASDALSNYVFLSVGRVGLSTDLIAQKFELVKDMEKRRLLMNLLCQQRASGLHGKNALTLVFLETKTGADSSEHCLCRNEFLVTAIHGNKERERSLTPFKSGATPIMVATDVGSRALGLSRVAHVVNYDLPRNIDHYVKRIGRTGSAGKSGIATAFFSESANWGKVKPLAKLMQQDKQEIFSCDYSGTPSSDFSITDGAIENFYSSDSSSTFRDIDLGEVLNDNIVWCKYTKPMPVQHHATPVVMAGRDLMACVKTGSGKMEEFGSPIISRRVKEKLSEPVTSRSGGSVGSLLIRSTRKFSFQIVLLLILLCSFLTTSIAFSPEIANCTPFQDYISMEPLGAGGFGSTFLAKRRDADIHVIKVLERGHTSIYLSGLRETYFGELFRGIPGVGREHIGRFVQSCLTDDVLLIISLYEGRSLDSLLATDWSMWLRTTSPGREAMRTLIYHMLSGLRYCHDMGVTHRDIKPANMVVCFNESGGSCSLQETGGRKSVHLRLIDFGSGFDDHTAQHLYDSDLPGRLGQTFSYWPPEAFERPSYMWQLHSATLRAKYDIWTAGQVILEMVLGTSDVLNAITTPYGQRFLKKLYADADNEIDDEDAKTLIRLISIAELCIFIDTDPDTLMPGSFMRYFPHCVAGRFQGFRSYLRSLDHFHFISRDDDLLELVWSLLAVHPDMRLTARDAMRHQYFQPEQGADSVHSELYFQPEQDTDSVHSEL